MVAEMKELGLPASHVERARFSEWSRRLQFFLLATSRGVEVLRDFADSVATLSRTRLIPVGLSADRVPN
jgi:hypothetical protein